MENQQKKALHVLTPPHMKKKDGRAEKKQPEPVKSAPAPAASKGKQAGE